MSTIHELQAEIERLRDALQRERASSGRYMEERNQARLQAQREVGEEVRKLRTQNAELLAAIDAERAKRVELQHHATDMAQAMADVQKNVQYLEGLRHGWSAHAADLAQRVADLEAEVDRITEAGRAHIRRAAAFEAQRDELLAALRALMQMDVRGHTLEHRMQFSDSGRELLGMTSASIARAGGVAAAGVSIGADPLFLLHCGAPFGGEVGEWEVEANSQRAVDELTAQHPGETLHLYALTPDEAAAVRALRSRTGAEGGAA